MRSRRTMLVSGAGAFLLLVAALLLGTGWVETVLMVLAVACAVVFLLVLLDRRQDPNGPRGQH